MGIYPVYGFLTEEKMRTDLIVAVIVAVFASTGFWTLINTIYQNNAKSKTAERAALVALLHDRIYGLSQEYIERGFVTIEEYDNLNYLWEPYSALGGNGTGKKLVDQVNKLDMKGEEK
jgi:hypothetical protein